MPANSESFFFAVLLICTRAANTFPFAASTERD
jgi:hypothetical protein